MVAVIYTRGADREEQARHCEEFAKANGIYVVSSDMDWEDIEKTVVLGEIDAVIVTDMSRITRKAKEYYSIKNIFDVFGTRIIAAPNYKRGAVK